MIDPNPYQPPEPQVLVGDIPEVGVESLVAGGRAGASVVRTILVWSVVCTLAAGPSFYWGAISVGGDNISAMLLGVAIYIALYVVLDLKSRRASWRNGALVPVAMKITYWLRAIMSVIFPIGLFLDLWFGMVSVMAWQSLFRAVAPNMSDNPDPFPSFSFVGTLAVTLTQGALLHLMLIAIFLFVWLIVFMVNDFKTRRSPRGASVQFLSDAESKSQESMRSTNA